MSGLPSPRAHFPNSGWKSSLVNERNAKALDWFTVYSDNKIQLGCIVQNLACINFGKRFFVLVETLGFVTPSMLSCDLLAQGKPVKLRTRENTAKQ